MKENNHWYRLRISCATGLCADEHNNNRNNNRTSNNNTDNRYNLHGRYRDDV